MKTGQGAVLLPPDLGGWGAFSGDECVYSHLLGMAQVRFKLLSAGFNKFSQAVDVDCCRQEESLQTRLALPR